MLVVTLIYTIKIERKFPSTSSNTDESIFPKILSQQNSLKANNNNNNNFFFSKYEHIFNQKKKPIFHSTENEAKYKKPQNKTLETLRCSHHPNKHVNENSPVID